MDLFSNLQLLHEAAISVLVTTTYGRWRTITVSILDPRLSSFIIISSYIHTLSWCQMVVRIQIAFKTIRTPETKKFEQGN